LPHTANRRVALRVDAVVGVSEVPHEHIATAESVAPGTRYVTGVAKLADGVLLIHDLQGFLSLEEERRLEQTLADA
jgi:purine-binding chemotaxis protein CheW